MAHAFLNRGYNVVATSRSISRAGYAQSLNLALVDGDIRQAATAEKVAAAAINTFGTIDHVVNLYFFAGKWNATNGQGALPEARPIHCPGSTKLRG